MKKILTAIMLLGLIIPTTLAQEDAGITPDKPFLYGIDRALDAIRLALTFDNDARADVALEIAQERLEEAKEMALQDKPEYTGLALSHFENRMNRASELITRGSGTGKTTAMFNLQSRLDKMGMDLEDLEESFGLVGINGQRGQALGRGMAIHSQLSNNMREKSQERLNELVANGELTEEEIQKLHEERVILRAEEMTEKVENKIDFIQKIIQTRAEQSEDFDPTESEEYLTEALQKLEESKQFYEEGNYESALETAREAQFMASHANTGVKINSVRSALGRMHVRK